MSTNEQKERSGCPLPSFEPWCPNLISLWAAPKLSSFGWWCFLLSMRFELSSALVASFPSLLASGLSSSSSWPVPGLFCQTLTQMPVMASHQWGSDRYHHCWWSLLEQLVNQDSLILGGSRVSLRELVDWSSLKFFRPFLRGISSLGSPVIIAR